MSGFQYLGVQEGRWIMLLVAWRSLLGGIAISLLCTGARADPDITTPQLGSATDISQNSDLAFRRGSFIAAPIPFSNPAIGSGLALGGGYLFQLAEGQETSYIGLGALRSDNGSEAYGLATKLAFRSGWTFDLTVAEADLRYDLFLGPTSFPLRQDGTLTAGGFSRDVSEHWTAGATFRYLETSISPDFSGVLPRELLPDVELELFSVGVTLDWDTRSDTDYPTDGALLSIKASRGFEVGGSRQYTIATANVDMYRELRPQTVVAARGSTCLASSDAPFFDQCSLGFSDSFRGFSPTRYFDARLVSAQVELRQRLGERFGFVAFGGVGWTGSDYGSLTDAGVRAAGGVGVRYRLSRKFPIDFSVDYSTNNESEQFLYIFVGQRF